jgi:hypothetical protein
MTPLRAGGLRSTSHKAIHQTGAGRWGRRYGDGLRRGKISIIHLEVGLSPTLADSSLHRDITISCAEGPTSYSSLRTAAPPSLLVLPLLPPVNSPHAYPGAWCASRYRQGLQSSGCEWTVSPSPLPHLAAVRSWLPSRRRSLFYSRSDLPKSSELVACCYWMYLGLCVLSSCSFNSLCILLLALFLPTFPLPAK